ncbi:hypothetical protein UFOVP1608_15 [uncultured Caudovirales phage]|uniref:Uncharacterized protein n=1 Tax=uncultured Caudovirales phage TaxID=2100421 RepID=A0A6J5SU16_9CAUD|nr:hypothetical protein UFOVP1608_15 [uncultured Caudovirales phage]
MATVTPKVLFRGAATTGVTTTLYTVPGSTSTVVTSIVVTNTAASAATFNLQLNGINIATLVAIAANSFVVIDLKQILTAGQILAGGASATTVNFHVSGTEIA